MANKWGNNDRLYFLGLQNHCRWWLQPWNWKTLAPWKKSYDHSEEVKLLSCVRLFATRWTVAHQAPLSMGFSGQEHWSGLPFPSPGDLPDPGIKPRSPALQADTLTSKPPGKPLDMTTLDSILKSRDYFTNKGASSQSYGFSSSHVWMWELGYKESWALKNWCFWTVVLEKTLESLLDSKKIKTVNPKGNQSWIFIGRTDAEAPILWPPDGKNWLIWKDPDAGKDWRQEEKGMRG